MREINVSHRGRTLTLEVNNNGNMPLTLLKIYFPKAQGMTYLKDGKWRACTVILDECKLDPVIDDYDVAADCEEEDSAGCSNQKNSNVNNKKKRIHEIMEKLKGKSNGKENKSSAVNQCNTERPAKKPKIIPKKDRKLQVGWLHKDANCRNYNQVKAPLGGSRTLIVNDTNYYTASEIRDMVYDIFTRNSIVRDLLKDCQVELGFFDGRALPHFVDAEGRECDLWEFSKAQNKSLYRLRLYLLSTPKESDARNVENQDPSNTEKNQDASNAEKQDSSNAVECQEEDWQLQYLDYEALERNKKFDMEDDFYDHGFQASNKTSDQTDEMEDLINQPIVNTVEVFYQRVSVSKYSRLPSVLELDKEACYDQVKVELLDECVERRDFDPVDYGFLISRIILDGQTLLKITIKDDLSREFEFPSADLATTPRHGILHDYTYLNGFCQNKYGLGVIPYCDDNCQPTFYWRKDDQLMKKGKFRYWFDDAQLSTNDGAGWTCEVVCDHADSRE